MSNKQIEMNTLSDVQTENPIFLIQNCQPYFEEKNYDFLKSKSINRIDIKTTAIKFHFTVSKLYFRGI